jgi:hypothetical protein
MHQLFSMKHIFVAVLTVFGGGLTSAQDEGEAVARPWTSYAAQGEYAAAIQSEVLPDGLPDDFAEQFLRDGEAQLLNFTGRYDEAYFIIAPEMFSENREISADDEVWVTPEALEGYRAANAIEYIQEAVRGRQVVIVNESHQMGRHRAFMAELLPILRAEGFTHFGMEALSQISETAWNQNGVPVREMGFYFGDPMMAHLLETAVAEQFVWFPYEVRSDQRLDCSTQSCSREARINHRETVQAQNIFERVFAQNPDARVVLYVGLAHLDETPGRSADGYQNGWMAAALSELTGYDPLTIDQVSGAGIGTTSIAQSARLISDRFEFSEPSVLIDQNDQALAPPPDRWQADLVVFTPTEGARENDRRPRWLWELPDRRSAWVDVSDVSDRPAVVQAFRLPMVENAIATDQYALQEGEAADQVHFLLPPGRYRVDIQLPDRLIRRPDILMSAE